MIAGALVLPEVRVGMIEASAMRSASMPWTRSRASTTARASSPSCRSDRVVGRFRDLPDPVQYLVVRVPPRAGRDLRHLHLAHRGRGHDGTGDADARTVSVASIGDERKL